MNLHFSQNVYSLIFTIHSFAVCYSKNKRINGEKAISDAWFPGKKKLSTKGEEKNSHQMRDKHACVENFLSNLVLMTHHVRLHFKQNLYVCIIAEK